VRVTFYKLTEKRLTTWEAARGKRIRVPGSTMALGRGEMPHDLLQLIVEAEMGIVHGFWGCVASGATFRSTGRKRTRPGRAVIAAHRGELDQAEHIVGVHAERWRAGASTPCTAALDAFHALWEKLGDGDRLTVEWPTLAVLPNPDRVRA
jgi:hypothetical protein